MCAPVRYPSLNRREILSHWYQAPLCAKAREAASLTGTNLKLSLADLLSQLRIWIIRRFPLYRFDCCFGERVDSSVSLLLPLQRSLQQTKYSRTPSCPISENLARQVRIFPHGTLSPPELLYFPAANTIRPCVQGPAKERGDSQALNVS